MNSSKTKGKSTNTSFNIDSEECLKPTRSNVPEQKKAEQKKEFEQIDVDAPSECSNEDKAKEESSKSKKTRGSTTSRKTHGLKDEERLPIRLNMLGIPNPNDVQGDPRSSASNHLTDVDPNKPTKSKSKEHKAKKVKVEKDLNMPNPNDVQVSTSNHLTDVDPNKHTKSKSKEHKAKKVKVELNPNILEPPPTSFFHLFDQDSENNVNGMAVNAWKSLSNEDKIHYLEKEAKRKAKYEKLQKGILILELVYLVVGYYSV
ncbi:hypothetical protein TSUD_145660 [Trifolium subterraneum]|uniref:Uncharacterized protein n=1 Tax=Trifolium subterraneum TaxID=3900 RepID=A0A2Z6N798_TRISU|nr:hypothetical protein TSUD_145660 [Trifolium subterraneum]